VLLPSEVTVTVVVGALASSVVVTGVLSIGGAPSKKMRACVVIFAPVVAVPSAATVKLTKPPCAALWPATGASKALVTFCITSPVLGSIAWISQVAIFEATSMPALTRRI